MPNCVHKGCEEHFDMPADEDRYRRHLLVGHAMTGYDSQGQLSYGSEVWQCQGCGDHFGPSDIEDGDIKPWCAFCRIAGKASNG